MSCVGALSFGKKLDLRCINIIRTLAMDAVEKANSGHPGTPMALAPITFVLWDRSLLYLTGWARISTAMDTSWLTISSQPGDRHRRRVPKHKQICYSHNCPTWTRGQ